MRFVLLRACLVCALTLPCTPAAAQGLHMWEGKDGAIVIQDKRPIATRPVPRVVQEPANATASAPADRPGLQEDAPRPAPVPLESVTESVTEPATEPHPLRRMQEQQANAESLAPAHNLPTDPAAEEYVQRMLAFDPEFREHWAQMSEEERQAHLQLMTMLAQQAPVPLGAFNALMRFLWVLQVVSVLSYVLMAWCLGRICEPLGVGSFAQFLIPIWNLYLVVKAAGYSGWSLLLFLVPLVNLGFYFHLMGTIAARLGKGYVAWAFALTIGAMFSGLLIGLYPFYLLGRHAQGMQFRLSLSGAETA